MVKDVFCTEPGPLLGVLLGGDLGTASSTNWVKCFWAHAAAGGHFWSHVERSNAYISVLNLDTTLITNTMYDIVRVQQSPVSCWFLYMFKAIWNTMMTDKNLTVFSHLGIIFCLMSFYHTVGSWTQSTLDLLSGITSTATSSTNLLLPRSW